MLWKILSGLSAVALGVGLWFAYQNQGLLKEELAQRDRALKNRDDVKRAQDKAVEAKDKKNKELADLTKQRDEARVEVTKANTTIDENQKEVDTLKKTLDEAQKQLTKMNEEILKAGDVKKLMAEVEDLTKQVKESEAAIANQEQQLALAQEKHTGVTGQIAKLKEVDSRQKRGQVEPSFSARVAQPFPDYGFVVLNKGNLGGVFANAMLDVRRGKNIIAKLRVRDVEQEMSVADLIPGSLANGAAIRAGDLVVAAPVPTPPVELPPAAAPGGAAAPASPAMAAPAMGAPPADPFGGPPAGTPPAAAPPPASADPFAPPAGGAMTTPPAAADGTPQKPSTADPFAK